MAIENLPMFELDHANPAPRRPFPGPATIRRVICHAGGHLASLMLAGGGHLTWRPHEVKTATTSWPCSASTRCLCDAPATPAAGKHTPTCAEHGPTGGRLL